MRRECFRWFVPIALTASISCGRYTHNRLGAMHGEGGASVGGMGAVGAVGASGGDLGNGAAGEGGNGNAGAASEGGDSSVNLVILPSSVPDARVNAPYTVAFSAQGGEPDYVFELSSGTLPRG